jgi:hypothetical protein
MEWIPNYAPDVFENEVPVFKNDMVSLFKKHKVYVFGYGSLLYPGGWRRRWMKRPPLSTKMIECTLNGFERGPWGLYLGVNYYGIIPNKDFATNGIVTRIWDLQDWINLMSTEMIAGLYKEANYRVVDVTDLITGWVKKPKSARIHCVVNRPINKELVRNSNVPGYYYKEVWEGINKYRSQKFIEMFLKSGGFHSGQAVFDFLKGD